MEIPLSPDNQGFRGIGNLGLKEGLGPESAATLFTRILSSTIGLMTIIAAIWFIFQFFTGAISIIGAGGDKAKIEEAKKKITNGLIGLVVVIAAVFIIDLIGNLIGLDILNPAKFIEGPIESVN